MSDQQDGDDTDAGLRTEDGALGRDPGALVCGSADTLVGDSGGDYPATGWSQLSRDDQVEHFQIIKLLGRGGMGEVYLARDTKLGRKVALKRILPNTLDNAESIERFLFEARTTAQFSHPNIVTVYAVGEHHGVPYLALEYLPGQTLRNRMKDGELSHREVARLGLAIAAALTEAHRHGVLHRDLKPANVVVPPDGRLRVLDFGLAGIVESVDAVTAAPGELGVDTHKDGLVGTPPYMAPEQWLCDTLTETVDVWALGLILYELVDGRHPYLGVDFTGLGAAVCAPDPVPPMSSREAVPEPLAEVIDGCLHKDSAKRLSASEIGRRLEAFLHFGGRRLDEDESPFRGLLPFTERHGSTFFGRDAEIDRFVEQLRHQSLVPVVGPSGAGKSSFVRAGVVPRLRDGARWVMVRMRPGNHPFETLAQELHRASADPASRDSTTDIRGPLVPDTSDLAGDWRRTEEYCKSTRRTRYRAGKLQSRRFQLKWQD